ncbi:MOSC domain-containing protein [Halovenus sp. WSH3]|uniref:MOSC domain-containing protein n=1 Tax=Halovenus carboxidivorans TaxID=2692199 RepID=A0A6B0T3S1_9EURY|nr:MOSC N-terminal beta barrel domain-containing protein [Halovenus carboxidivorans]MXR52928.1 MOSC domain-containing protein [Halovenus carboxidivorans]
MPTLSQILVYPVKALDPVRLPRVSVSSAGGLAHDRIYGIKDEDGNYVHGKRTAAVHRLDTEYDPATKRLTGRVRGEGASHEFHLEDDRATLEAWLSEYFGTAVHLERGTGGNQTDSAVFTEDGGAGPTLVSRGTLEEVASWYDDIDSAEMCLRLRPNLVVSGVPPFWEDQLFTDGGRRFRIGEVALSGVRPIPRCVVPTRDPRTGAEHPEFRETFVHERRERLPAWVDVSEFDGNLFSLAVGTRIPESDRNRTLSVGDPVRL